MPVRALVIVGMKYQHCCTRLSVGMMMINTKSQWKKQRSPRWAITRWLAPEQEGRTARGCERQRSRPALHWGTLGPGWSWCSRTCSCQGRNTNYRFWEKVQGFVGSSMPRGKFSWCSKWDPKHDENDNKTQCQLCKRVVGPFIPLSWSCLVWKRILLWMWSLGGRQQPFSCVLSHFRHGHERTTGWS